MLHSLYVRYDNGEPMGWLNVSINIMLFVNMLCNDYCCIIIELVMYRVGLRKDRLSKTELGHKNGTFFTKIANIAKHWDIN